MPGLAKQTGPVTESAAAPPHHYRPIVGGKEVRAWTMVALQAHARGCPEQLRRQGAQPGPGDRLIAVHAAITFAELT